MDERQIFLRDVLTVLFKRKVLIIFFVVAVIAVVFAGNLVWPSTYEAAAEIRVMRGREINPAFPTVVRSGVGATVLQMGQEDVKSEMQLFYSNDVLRRVVQEANLAGRPIGATNPLTPFLPASRTDPERAAMDELAKAIHVEPVQDTHMLSIILQMPSADGARDVLDILLNAYEEKHVEVFKSADTADFFEEQIARTEEDLSRAQTALRTFVDQHRLVSIDVEKQLLIEQYSDAKRLLVQLEDTAPALEPGAPISDAALIEYLSRSTDNTVVTELQLKLLELILRRNNIQQSQGPNHPQTLAVNNEINIATDRLRDAIDTTRAVTQARLNDIETRIREINEIASELDNLEREVRVATEAAEYYQQKLQEAVANDAMSNRGISNIVVTSRPDLPDEPVSPNRLLNLFIALVAGMIGAVALAFFLEYLDHGLKNPEDIEHYLGIAPLASFFRSSKPDLDAREAQRLATLASTATASGDTPVALVTSSVNGEGAHRVAEALSKAQAEDPSARVLYIDFATPNGQGLTDVLLGDTPLESVLAATDENLVRLTRGSHADCPAYVWGSERMREIMGELAGKFDSIVLHTPPILAASDAINAARVCNGIIVCIKADATRREVVQRALNSLKEGRDKVVGAVLTERRQVIPGAVYKRI